MSTESATTRSTRSPSRCSRTRSSPSSTRWRSRSCAPATRSSSTRATSPRALCDASGNTVMQGSQDIAVHVGTLHFTAKAVHRGLRATTSTRATCSPSTTPTSAARTSTTSASSGRSSTRASSSRSRSPTATGPTSAAACPGSFDVNAKEHFGEGLRIPPVRIWDEGRYRDDVVAADRLQHARAERRRGRPARAGRGDARGRAGDPAAGRQVRRRHGR